MSTAEVWESAYQKHEHWSVWPWSSLISLVYRHCSPIQPGMKVLELGCGTGANIPFFNGIGADYYAVEVSKTAVADIHKRFPNLKSKVLSADFTKEAPFSFKFDLIFDRGAVTHNNKAGVDKVMQVVRQSLMPKGRYIGVHWFSTNSAYATLGEPYQGETTTRKGYTDGPYKGVEPVHFFSEAEIKSLFQGFEIVALEEETQKCLLPEKTAMWAAWNLVGVKNG